MATRTSIKIDLQNANNKADRLDEVAADLESLANKELDGTLEALAASWKGKNAESYIGKGYDLSSDILGTVKNLRSAAKTIRQIALNIYNAELRAIEIAEARAYQEWLRQQQAANNLTGN